MVYFHGRYPEGANDHNHSSWHEEGNHEIEVSSYPARTVGRRKTSYMGQLHTCFYGAGDLSRDRADQTPSQTEEVP